MGAVPGGAFQPGTDQGRTHRPGNIVAGVYIANNSIRAVPQQQQQQQEQQQLQQQFIKNIKLQQKYIKRVLSL